MFTRRIIMQIKADAAAEFTRIVELQLLPPLRGQPIDHAQLVVLVDDGAQTARGRF